MVARVSAIHVKIVWITKFCRIKIIDIKIKRARPISGSSGYLESKTKYISATTSFKLVSQADLKKFLT